MVRGAYVIMCSLNRNLNAVKAPTMLIFVQRVFRTECTVGPKALIRYVLVESKEQQEGKYTWDGGSRKISNRA